MSDKLSIWDAVATPDPKFTKDFNKGGFKGKATSPVYLARRATEQFGPYGLGWGVEIEDERYVEGHIIDERGTRAVIHVLRIVLWYMQGDKRGEARHYGQTDFVGKNKHGPFTDEEAPKKSFTDAMTKALSLMGFAADIHMGLFDDNKYVAEANQGFRQEERKADPKALAYEAGERLKKLMDAIKDTSGCDLSAFAKAHEGDWSLMSEKARDFLKVRMDNHRATLSQKPLEDIPF